jgi:hypothetical protein
VQQPVGQVAQHGELAGGPDRPLRQQVARLRRGGVRLPGLLHGQCGLVDQPQEPEQLIIGQQRQAEPGQDGLLRIAGDGYRLPGGEHSVLGHPAAQPGAGLPLQDRLHPAAVQPPGLRADGQRAQRGVVDDHRPVQVPGQLLGDVLQVLLEHLVVMPGGPAGDAPAFLHLSKSARPAWVSCRSRAERRPWHFGKGLIVWTEAAGGG